MSEGNSYGFDYKQRLQKECARAITTNRPRATILCECTEHTEAREALLKAWDVLEKMTTAHVQGKDQEAKTLLEELEKLNNLAAPAQQCIYSEWS